MQNLNPYDPTQKPTMHNDLNTFDDPIRKVGRDVAATFDSSDSNPTEWAGSEALGAVTDNGIDDATLRDVDDEEDEADEEDLDAKKEDEDIDESEDRVFTRESVKKFH